MLMPDDFKAHSKTKVDYHLYNKWVRGRWPVGGRAVAGGGGGGATEQPADLTILAGV